MHNSQTWREKTSNNSNSVLRDRPGRYSTISEPRMSALWFQSGPRHQILWIRTIWAQFQTLIKLKYATHESRVNRVPSTERIHNCVIRAINPRNRLDDSRITVEGDPRAPCCTCGPLGAVSRAVRTRSNTVLHAYLFRLAANEP